MFKRMMLILPILLICLSAACGEAGSESKAPVADTDIVQQHQQDAVSEGLPDVDNGSDSISNPDNTVAADIKDNPPESAAKPAADQPSEWNLILVNKQNPLEEEVNITLSEIYGDYKADSRIVDSFNSMYEAALSEDIHLVVHSAYRSISKQKYLFDRKVNQYLEKGYSEENAKAAALSIVAYPGESEHHTGLCLDITSKEWLSEHGNDPLISGFRDSRAGKWLKENAKNYGFILRYPEGKEDITGYSFEPWHYRYVGTEHSVYIMDNNLTLEEYLISDY